MGAIHQFIPTLLPGDGTGNAARAMQHRLIEIGLESNCFVQEDKAELGYPKFDEYPKYAKPDDILIYHLATSSAIPNYLKSLTQDIVVNYQNLTPAKYFEPYDSGASALQNRGLAELRLLAERSVMGIAPSKFNVEDLIQAGFPVVEQVPIIFNPADFMGPRDAQVSKMMFDLTDRGFSNWIFVGRLVPNKAQERLIMALAAHRDLFGDTAVLHLVGRPSYRLYMKSLYDLVARLGLEERVNFVMGVTPAELASFYSMADIFISASEHEGFCMPIVEALFHELPVIAFSAAAVPETLGVGGIHISDRDPVVIATWAHKVATSSALRRHLRELASLRARQLSPRVTVTRFDEAISRLLQITKRNWEVKFSTPSSLATSAISNGVDLASEIDGS